MEWNTDAPGVRVDSQPAAPQANSRERTLFGHPLGLFVLFSTEMWEKFSYYGMRALLVYYMVGVLRYPIAQASIIYGGYTAMAYLTPIFGGYIADRWLGRHRAVMLGGSIMALGHFMLTQAVLFYPALVAIVLGNGLFLPSLPGQVRALYRKDDPRLTSAYSIYYVGINVGGFLAPLVCGALGELVGWDWGFGAAGVGMLLGLIVYTCGAKWLPASSRAPAPQQVSSRTQRGARTDQRPLIMALGLVALVVVIYRAAYEQQGNSVALWIEGVDRHVGAWTIPMTWFQSLNSLIIFVAAPFLAARWTRSAAGGREVPPLRRMAFGAALGAGSYVWLALVQVLGWQNFAGVGSLTIAVHFLLLTISELYILPVGLALFGQIAPKGFESTLIALWFLSSFGGNLASGILGALWSSMSHQGFFLLTAAVCLVSSALLLYLNSFLMPRLAHKSIPSDIPFLP